jgi:CRP-like cAMP-binding protein
MFLFRYLSYQELLRILKIVYEEHYERGKPIFKEGELGDALYLVFAGSVDIRKGSYHLTTIGPGGHFGELAFMDGNPRSATVVATEPTTVLTVRRDEFRDLTRTDPEIASKLLWCFVLNLSGRLRDLSSDYVRARET